MYSSQGGDPRDDLLHCRHRHADDGGERTPHAMKHTGNVIYNVTYTVTEMGNSILIVKWGDDCIPGSLFHITVSGSYG
uniref:Filamin-B-like n=1 Tax=Petromyzon marinus TaxID=7757 RepID=A0AAJ7XHY0_PETMA|nr:filamin-B-like [Petromyzon marinus]